MKITILIAMVALLLFRRIKRSIGFQKFSETSLIIRMVIFGLIALLMLFGAIINPFVLIYDVIGIIAGIVLAYIATNHAQFEKREKGLYYKTHVWVEIAVIVLFIARFGYRLYMMKDMMQASADTPEEMQTRLHTMQDPFTGAMIFVFCAYYIGYFSFILREAKAALSTS